MNGKAPVSSQRDKWKAQPEPAGTGALREGHLTEALASGEIASSEELD